MSHRDSTENAVNGSGSSAKTDTPVTRGRSGPVRYELIGADGRTCCFTFISVQAAGAYAKDLWPDQEQDEDRAGKGWDVQCVGCE